MQYHLESEDMPSISTRKLDALPDVTGLKQLLQSMAMLDAILCPEWEFRYYSFDVQWNTREQMGSMRNGEGDDFFALFNDAGCFLKGFVHECIVAGTEKTPPGIFDDVPSGFSACLTEPAFKMDDVTFCMWRRHDDPCWECGQANSAPGDDPDGSLYLLSPLDGHPQTYRTWAEEYYERDVDIKAVTHVYEHGELDDDFVKALNSETSLAGLADDILGIGYPNKLST